MVLVVVLGFAYSSTGRGLCWAVHPPEGGWQAQLQCVPFVWVFGSRVLWWWGGGVGGGYLPKTRREKGCDCRDWSESCCGCTALHCSVCDPDVFQLDFVTCMCSYRLWPYPRHACISVLSPPGPLPSTLALHVCVCSDRLFAGLQHTHAWLTQDPVRSLLHCMACPARLPSACRCLYRLLYRWLSVLLASS